MTTAKTEKKPASGWMGEKPASVRIYHYIRDTMSLCRRYGFYAGPLVPAAPGSPRGNEDCAQCFRILQGQQHAAKLAGRTT